MRAETLPTPDSFENQFTHLYVAPPSVQSHKEWTTDPNHYGGHYFMTRPSEIVETRYNPESVLASDPVSDAFGRMAAYGLGSYYDKGGERDLPTRELMASRLGGSPEDYRYRVIPKPRATERGLDLGSGSGVFTVGLLSTIPVEQRALHIDVVDNDAIALLTADRNIQAAISKLHSAPEVQLKLTSWLEGITGKYGIIYFNPPYLPPDHDIRSAEAALAPYNAIRVAEPWQEYEKVVPYLPEYLDKDGVAIIRLPKEPDAAMFEKLGEFCQDMREPYRWMLVETVAGEQQRQGFALLIVNGSLPGPFGEYDYAHNYLEGKYKSYAPPSDTMSIYSDAFCEVRRLKPPAAQARLGLMDEVRGARG